MDLIAPPQKVQDSVLNWIDFNAQVYGKAHVHRVENLRDAIRVTATASFVERLFQTEMHQFYNSKKKGIVIKHLGDLSTPVEIAEHIDIITGITEFPPTDLPFLDRKAGKRASPDDPLQGNDCNVPYTLKNLYGVPQNLSITNTNSNASIYAEQSAGYPEGFGLPSLNYFETANDVAQDDITCILGTGKQYYVPNDTDIEGHLDTEMFVGMTPGANICFYIMEYGNGWMFEFASYVFQTPGAPWIISMSYGWVEVEQCINATTYPFLGNCTALHIPNSAQYINRTNTEFMKLGTIGHSLLAASGDDGTAGTHGSWDGCQEMGPIYPAASPWVTTVGATSIEPMTSSSPSSVDAGSAPPICTSPQYGCQCSTSTNEQIAQDINTAGFDTGGGFSQFSPMQSYQTAAVQAYLNSGVTLPLSSLYNPSNRAFPDIGAVGEQFCLLDPGQSCFLVGGTSASTPLIGSLLTLLNQDRFNAGKSPLGFFNPVIYKMYALSPTQYFHGNFTDGNNSGECPPTHGFNAYPGWNPLVGVGSPHFAAIRQYVSTLP